VWSRVPGGHGSPQSSHALTTITEPPYQFKSCSLITLAPVSNDEGEEFQDRDDDDPLVQGEINDSHWDVSQVALLDREGGWELGGCLVVQAPRPPTFYRRLCASLTRGLHRSDPTVHTQHAHTYTHTVKQDGTYHLLQEIVVRRHVTLQGDPIMMPLIDCQLSVRCFRVKVTTGGA
jgi:hypothetical protein